MKEKRRKGGRREEGERSKEGEGAKSICLMAGASWITLSVGRTDVTLRELSGLSSEASKCLS